MKNHKSYTKRPKSSFELRTTYFKSDYGVNDKTCLNTLRNRTKNIKNVCPEQAAEVIKNYVVPLFERRVRSKDRCRNNIRSGLSMDSATGPIPDEINLSSQLYSKLQVEKDNIKKITQKIGELQQEQMIDDSGKEDLSLKISDLEINLEYFKIQLSQMAKEANEVKGLYEWSINQMDFYKERNEELEKVSFELASLLYIERAKSDIRLYSIYFLDS